MMTPGKHKVIDNFLDKEYFDRLVKTFTYEGHENLNSIMPWYFTHKINKTHDYRNTNLFYLVHIIYSENEPRSEFYGDLVPLLSKLGYFTNTYRSTPHLFAGESEREKNVPSGLIRIKANLYPNTETLQEHPMHTDYGFPHNAAILYLNTCNGYTKLEDGTKIDSVANRLLLFDASEKHCSTTTTNDIARFNININFY